MMKNAHSVIPGLSQNFVVSSTYKCKDSGTTAGMTIATQPHSGWYHEALKITLRIGGENLSIFFLS